MKDIDGQEIQIGDVVIESTTHEICVVTEISTAATQYPITVKYNQGKNKGLDGICKTNEIFCLFYRKPTKE